MSPRFRPWLMAIAFALIGLSLSSIPGVKLMHVIDGEIYESPLSDDVYAAAQSSQVRVESYLVAFGHELPGQPLVWMALVVLVSAVFGYRIGLRIERYRATRAAQRQADK